MSGQIEERLEKYMLEVIMENKKGKWPSVLRVILKQLSYVFSVIVQTRLFLYESSIMRPHMLGCQVVSVGNLTVGGTGKTPIVEVLARYLQESGRKVATKWSEPLRPFCSTCLVQFAKVVAQSDRKVVAPISACLHFGRV